MTEKCQTSCILIYKGFLKISPHLRPPKIIFFPDKTQSKFLDISDYFLAAPLKILKYNLLSFHCFPEEFFGSS